MLCTQNLKMYGKYADVRTKLGNISPAGFREKENAIARRVIAAGCDVIAVQEVISRSDDKAEEVVKGLATMLKAATGRTFDARAGFSNDEGMRNGFLVARDRAVIENIVSYHQVELPKLSAEQKPDFLAVHLSRFRSRLNRKVKPLDAYFL